MDPNANLDEQLKLAEAILKHSDDLTAIDLAELVVTLNDGLKRGGAYPLNWVLECE